MASQKWSQPDFTLEIDLRPWQHMGQHDPTVHLIEVDAKKKKYHILFHPNPENKTYLSEEVTKVATFGKRNMMNIYEGKYARYFVDFYQTKLLHKGMLKDFEHNTPALHTWKPTVQQYIAWKTKFYDKAQGLRIETILARFPVNPISTDDTSSSSSTSGCVVM